MKITVVEALQLEAPVLTPWRIATASMSSLCATVVRIRTDEGVTGIGEAIVRLGPGVTATVVREILAPLLIGRDPMHVEAIWDDMYRTMRARGHSRGFMIEAMSGVDMALWDLVGKRLGLPVSVLLFGHGRTCLRAYASSILLAPPEEMAAQARVLAAQGFTGIKMKVGEDLATDRARIQAVRAAVGPKVDLMLDANSGYTAATAVAVAAVAERLGVYWLEEPVPPDDLPGYRRIRASTRIRLAAGESEFTVSAFRELLAAGLLDVVQPDIARAGGFTGCRRIAALAGAYNCAVAPHTGASGPLCIAASLHLGAALAEFLVFEHMFLDNPLREIITPRLPEPSNGVIDVPMRPGLGFELDEAAVERFLGARKQRGVSMLTAQFGNALGKVEGYRRFWSRADASRPLVGFTLRGFFPMDEYAVCGNWPVETELTPDMVVPDAFLEDQERLLREGVLLDDDILRGDMPAAAVIPWLSGMLGGRLRILPGNVLGEDRALSWAEIEGLHLDRNHPWFQKYVEFAQTLVRHARGRYPVSHGALVGPSDLLAEWRGHTQSILDIMEEPERAMQALWRATHIFEEVTCEIWKHLPLFAGGYFDGMYQLWSPGPIIRMQEDASGLYSPALYRQFLQPLDRYLAQRFASAFIHLHSTSMFLLDAFLEIEELRCFEINNDAIGGPPLAEMVSYFRKVQTANRSLLIRGAFTTDDIRLLMDSLDPRGLYLLILIKDRREVDPLRPLLKM